jgi:pimeloyl-ACP methyl ester carboxylesterase
MEEFAQIGEIELCYETHGDPDDPVMLLVMGLGTQMVAWRPEFCEQLASHGFRVVRFDNRDIGRSTWMKGRPPTLAQMLTRSPKAGRYRLRDMAADAIGLLDHLGARQAHVVGASMGGMIAQSMAAHWPERVLSLASIMSNTGSRWAGQPHHKLYPIFLGKTPEEREAYIERTQKLWSMIGSPGFDRDDEEIAQIAAESYDRGLNPAGTGRQMGAIIASGDRTKDLAEIRVPTVVIHGDKDILVRPSGGRATAKAIPGAKLVTIKGMGHDLPRGAWDQIIEAVVENARRAAPVAETAAA